MRLTVSSVRVRGEMEVRVRPSPLLVGEASPPRVGATGEMAREVPATLAALLLTGVASREVAVVFPAIVGLLPPSPVDVEDVARSPSPVMKTETLL